MSVEDLRFALRHHWAHDRELYSTERQRVQMSLMLLLYAYTGSRPGAIIDSGCARGSNRALRYRDVELMLIPNPQSGGLTVADSRYLFTFSISFRSIFPITVKPERLRSSSIVCVLSDIGRRGCVCELRVRLKTLAWNSGFGSYSV